MQEGIGAFIAYLPSQVAISTLRDFLNILSPDLKVVSQSAPIAAPATLVNVPTPGPPPKRELPLIEGTVTIDLPEMTSQVDFLSVVGENHFIVGSTTGQVAVYNSHSHTMEKMLIDEGLSIYELCSPPRKNFIAIACDGGLV